MKDKKIITKGIALSISLLGIVLLLALQFIWFKSAYQISEQNLKEKCNHYLSESIDKELFKRISQVDVNVRGINYNNSKDDTIVSSNNMSDFSAIKLDLQNFVYYVGKECNLEKLDSIFNSQIIKDIGFCPKHTFYLIRDTLSKSKILKYKYVDRKAIKSKAISINEIDPSARKQSLRFRINSEQSLIFVFTNPGIDLLNQAKSVLFYSIILVGLIAFTLIYLLNSALRENRFVRFIKEYTHALTHDLRSPLNSINMASSILYDDTNPIDEKQKKNYLRICKDQSRSMLDNIERILTVAKAEQTQLVATKMNVVLHSFLSSVSAAFVDNNVHIKPIEVIVHCESENGLASIDPVLMTNVLNNLMDNAVKYSYETVKITIHAFISDNWWHISVKDDGMGIPANDLEAIFEQFNQGSLLERKRMFGYGIGLTFTKKVINAHGGTLQITSKEMEGSEFTILLPTN